MQFNREEWANQLKPVLKHWKELTGGAAGGDVLKTRFDASADDAAPVLAFVLRYVYV